MYQAFHHHTALLQLVTCQPEFKLKACIRMSALSVGAAPRLLLTHQPQ